MKKIQTIALTIEQIMLVRDCISEETVRTRRYMKDQPRPTERAVQRAQLLEDLLVEFKNRSI